jgi:tripartite-type tricarboxylate transporter receptor subunit TctC
VRIVVPGTGGGGDFAARLIGQGLAPVLGQPFVVENRPVGTIPGEIVSRAAPDGHTLLLSASTLWLAPLLQPNVPYDPQRDFTPVSLVTMSPNILVVPNALPVKSVKELIALARKNPGQLNYATSGAGTVGHLAMELLSSQAKVSMAHIPYKGSGQAITDAVGGYVTLMAASMPVFVSHVQAGKLRPLGVTSAKRSPALPNVPTIAEQGFPGYEVSSGFGMLAPAGLPAAMVRTVNSALVKALQDGTVRERLSSQGAEPVGSTPEAHEQMIRNEIARWTKIVQQVGIKATLN